MNMNELADNCRGAASGSRSSGVNEKSCSDASPFYGSEGENKHVGSSPVAFPLNNAPAGSLGVIIGNFSSIALCGQINRVWQSPVMNSNHRYLEWYERQ